jgi:alkanesulfonate monooxygenase SsuD/methylene tetrahydromethanopterin reductase-like flavin-dependent oxidoreductase (luciferase family)
MPPLMLGASGERMLRLAAREADIVSFTVTTPEADPEKVLAGRIELVRSAAGERFQARSISQAAWRPARSAADVPE